MKPPAEGRRSVPDRGQEGLWLRITSKGTKSWSIVYRPQGSTKSKRYTMPGRWPAVGVKEARDIARAILLQVAKGGDPAAEKKRTNNGDLDLFEHVARKFVEDHVKPRRPRSWRETGALLGFPLQRGVLQLDELSAASRLVRKWKGRRIGEITRGDVVRAIDDELDAGRHRTANKLLAAIKAFFAYAAPRHDLDRNPAETIGRQGVERSRDHVLSPAELTAIWDVSGKLGWPWGPCVRLLILTTQRRAEVAHMRWSEVDLDAGTWTIPAERSKSRRAHTVPLSAGALAILRDAPRLLDCNHVFWSGRRGGLLGYSQAKAKLDRLSGVTGWRLHDVRRSAATGMAELGVQPHVLAAVLNHAPASTMGVTSIYNRHQYSSEKRLALDLWAEHVLALADGSSPKVVALPTA